MIRELKRLRKLPTTFLQLIRGLCREDGSVGQKTVRGGIWVFGGRGTARVLQVAQTAILARLLIPEDFGLMRLVMVALSAATSFSNFGINQALIQRKEISHRTLDTAWVMDLFRYVLMFLATLALAGPIATFYEEPQLAWMIRIVSLKFLLLGFSNNSGIAMLRRDMRFRRKQTYEIVLSISNTVVTVMLAFWLRNVWALVWAQVIYGAGEFAGSYWVHPFRPHFHFFLDEARSLFSFGKHLLVGGMLNFLKGSLASILLGKLLGTETLGYYSLARSLVMTPKSLVVPVFGVVLYPAFSQIQARVEALQRAFIRSIGVGCLAIAPMLVGIAVTANPLVSLIYGQRYMPVAAIAVVFSFVKLFEFVALPAGSLLKALGKPYWKNLSTLIRMAIFVPLLFWLTPYYGVLGVVWALVPAAAVETSLLVLLVFREIGVPLRDFTEAVVRPISASLLMGGTVWALGYYTATGPFVSLSVMVPAGILVYAIWSVCLNGPGWQQAFKMVRQATQA